MVTTVQKPGLKQFTNWFKPNLAFRISD